MASGCLLLLSFLKYFYHPLQWLAVGAVAVGLFPILMRSLAAIRNLTLDINILVLIAVAGTLALRDYWEAGSIVFLFTIAEWLESRASHKATAVMSSLMSMAPQKAVLAESGIVVDTKDVKVNTVLAVKAGEVIPIDGIVIDGNSEVDEKTLTGESLPVAKQIQSNVWAGTMNLNGYISVKTTRLAEDSAVAMMAKLVEEAQHNKSKTQRLIDNCAKYYTPIVVLISGAVAVIPVALKAHNLRHWFHLALVLLVSACPCALILSTPVAIFCALAKAATMGLLVKGGDCLEALARVKVVAFDKTGTITRGEFTVTECQSLSQDVSSADLLYWVSSIESKASHPVAAALVEYSQSNGVEPNAANVEDFQIFPGEGIYGKMDEKEIYIGNSRIATRTGCTTVPVVEGVRDGSTVVYVILKGTAVGILRLSDTCRTGAVEAIKELKSLGIRTVMLTGDNRAAAAHIQHQLGERLEEVHAELLPEEKVKLIKDLKHRCGPTAMVGDGMNDAPALATADIGISMGISGSAVAIETGQVTLMSNDIRKIPFAICISRNTRRRIIENVALSIATKAAILGLALAGHPLLWAAVAADVGTCLLVIFNSMRLMGGTRVSHAQQCSDTHDEHNDHGHSHGHNHDHDHNHNHDHNHHSHGRCASISCGLFGSKHEAHTTCGSADKREGLAAAAHWSCGDDHHEHGELEKHVSVPSVRDCSKSCTRGTNGCHDHSSGVADEVADAGAVDKGCGSDIEAHLHEGGCCK